MLPPEPPHGHPLMGCFFYSNGSISHYSPWGSSTFGEMHQTGGMAKKWSQKTWHLVGDTVALMLIVGGVTTPFHGRGDWEVTLPVLAIAFAMGLVLFLRRRKPFLVIAIIIFLTIALMAFEVSGPVIGIPIAISVYAAALSQPPQRAWLTSGIGAAVLMVAFATLTKFDVYDPSWIAFIAIPAFAVAAGSYSRSRRELLRSTEERARVAEEGREAEARGRVAEERLRIARDLHDVVAHQIAAISLHAELAELSLDKAPEVASSSLAVIKTAARQGLHDISDLMKVLRENQENLPSPSLRNLDDLLARYLSSGLRLESNCVGQLQNLPANVDSVAFRVVQEGLTNCNKHSSDGLAVLRIERRPAEILIRISNRTREKSSNSVSSGFGLIGIRERVATVGGSVETQQINGKFLLEVRLPLTDGEA